MSYVIRLHYNRQGERKGFPWTLHTSQGCFPASHVVISVPCVTEEKPKKKTNPRYFVKVHGVIHWDKGIATIRGES